MHILDIIRCSVTIHACVQSSAICMAVSHWPDRKEIRNLEFSGLAWSCREVLHQRPRGPIRAPPMRAQGDPQGPGPRAQGGLQGPGPQAPGGRAERALDPSVYIYIYVCGYVPFERWSGKMNRGAGIS